MANTSPDWKEGLSKRQIRRAKERGRRWAESVGKNTSKRGPKTRKK